MITSTDEKIIALFIARSEQAISELDTKYGQIFRSLSNHIVSSWRDAEECVNDAYLGTWNTIPPVRPNVLAAYVCKIVRNISLKCYYKKTAAKRSSVYIPAQTYSAELLRSIAFPKMEGEYQTVSKEYVEAEIAQIKSEASSRAQEMNR